MFSQTYNLEGKVTSDNGEALFGVNIFIEGTARGTMTDEDGRFQINVKQGEALTFSFIGFVTAKRTVENDNFLEVTLVTDQSSLEEVMVVGYGETKRITNTGAVSSIKAEEVKYVPVSSVQNTLSGRLPGFFSQQRSGQPGRDASDFFIRGVSSLNSEGNRPLIIVDDVQYTYEQLQQINVNEIESISILKDASTTAVYGIKGANGVLVIKTRRGNLGKPKINVRVEGGVQMPIREPDFLDSYHTALLVNEAYENDGLQPQFSERDLELFRTGEDPYGHPNVNWYDAIFKDYAFQENANIDISGGTDRLKYFVSGGAFSQNGLINDFSDPFNEVNNNYFYRRFNYRANLDFDVTNSLSLRLDVTSRFGNINQPRGQNVVSEIYNFAKIHPYSAPFMNPNGTYSYAYDTQENLPTINARIANGGYNRIRRTDSNILFGVTQDFSDWIDGLSITGRLAYSSVEENSRQVYRSSFPTYRYNPENDSYTIDPRGNYAYGTYSVLGNLNVSTKNLNIQGFLNYNKVIEDDHNFDFLFLYNRQSTSAQANVPANFEGYTAKVNYNFKEKYLFDLNVAYNGTDRFGADNRFGFFPALGVGYNISKEPFFKDALPFVDLLKIKSSYGIVGSDITPGNRYLYRQVYQNGGGYIFGESPIRYPTVFEGNLGNPNVTWEKARKFNVGIDGNIFDSKFSFEVNYFYDYRFDQLVTRENVPQILGIGISPNNIAETSNQGFDGQIGYQNSFGEFQFSTNLVFSYAKNKVLYKAEAQQAYPWLAETGQPIGQPFGYTYTGFYTQEDIANLNDGDPDNDVAVPLSDVPVQAGDLKYQDLNGDGIINNFDQSPIGKPNLPTTTLGWNFGLNYKGFSARVLLQGSFDYSFSVVGTGIEPFKSQFQPLHLQRWTPQTADTAEFPRLTSNPSTVNSSAAYMSDFWLVDAWYVRLKTVDLSYQLPDKWLPFDINNARLYVNAYNLLTLTSYDKYQQDPEISSNTAGDSYFNQRVVNLGLQVGF